MAKIGTILHNTLRINQLVQLIDNQLVINISKIVPKLLGIVELSSYLYIYQTNNRYKL